MNETIEINGKTWYSSAPANDDIKSDLKIVVLQRGWVLIGRFSSNGDQCTLTNAHVIRRWGTSDGLGQLAKFGKQSETIIDSCNGEVNFNVLTMVLSIDCDESKWMI